MIDGEDRDGGAAVEQDDAGQVAEAPQMTELEQTAYEMGWRPKDQFEGPEGGWKDAKSFVKSGPRREDKREIRRLHDQIDRMARTTGRMMEDALTRQASEIEERFKAAVKDGDEAGAAKAARDMNKLQDEAREQTGSKRDYETDFAQENPWYGTHKAATTWARARSQELGAEKVPADRQLEIIAEEARSEFPHLFEKKAVDRKGPLSVSAPSRGGERQATQDFAGLPGDVKRTCDGLAEAAYTRFGKGADKAKYMSEYRDRYAKTYFADKAA